MLKAKFLNLLVVRNDRFGEFILNIPAINALRESFSQAKISLLVSERVKQLILRAGLADEIISCESLRGQTVFHLWKWLKKKKFDAIVILNPSKQLNIASFLAGIKVRLGYDKKCGFLLTHRIADRKFQADKHEVLYNLDLVGVLGAAIGEPVINLKFGKEDEEAVVGLLDGLGREPGDTFVALHPFTSDRLKQWPRDNFKALSSLLAEQGKVKVIIIGGPEETDVWKGASFSGERVIDLVGRLSLRQTGVILRHCRILVSSDSGPVHLAASQGTKVCAIFRNDLPGKGRRRWGPWGSGHIVIESDDLSKITPEMVMGKIKKEILK